MNEEQAITVIVAEGVPVADDALIHAGQIADQYAKAGIFEEYQGKQTANTRRRQKGDLATFARYLADAHVTRAAEDLYTRAESWTGITYGLLKGFVKWQLDQGYAIGSINVRLATIKAYCRLAAQSGAIQSEHYDLIKTVKGYSHKVGRNVDQERTHTRKGPKKAEPTSIGIAHAVRLKKQHPETIQGYRDSFLMCLLLDHGLRCGEIAGLSAGSIDLEAGTFTFYREKVDKVQTHTLTHDTLLAAMNYLPYVSTTGPLFYGYRGRAMSTRGLHKRVRELGASIGLAELAPHDCRHYWATRASRNNTPVKALQTAGGWASPAMPLRYAEAATIANEGVNLG